MTTRLSSARGLDGLQANGPRLLFADHHLALEGAYRALLAATYTDDPRDLIIQFKAFEHELLEHMAAEEEVILPAYEQFVPTEARTLREDHVRIRQQLMRIGIDCDLHAIRADTMKNLIVELRAHADREDAHMYPWAQVHLPLRAKRDLFVRLGTSLRRLAQITERPASAG